ncbi:MAG TPA: glycoside hydrolase family 2 protein [Alphaproteobacteria bacterium]|nr:glycoside hydrolase family 2 protein [Alphaproteobacteria bacterium]
MAAIAAPARSRVSDYSELDLSGEYELTSPTRKKVRTTITLPGDVHSALIRAGEIPDPYFGDNEQAVMWVSRTPWTMERTFKASSADLEGYLTLTLEGVDTIARVILNGETVAHTQNMFVRYDIDVTGKVRAGDNTLRLEFEVARDVARARAEAHPFPIPFTSNYLSNGLEGVHMNFIRKVACHAGWDWGICLMPTGVYGRMAIRRSRLARQESVQVAQRHARNRVELTVTTRIFAFADGEVSLTHRLEGDTVGGAVRVTKGENVFVHTLVVRDPRLWWPNGQGDQPLYTLVTTLDGERTTRRIGLRQLEWVIEKDAIDHTFKCRINGRDITMMGANWIPADAIPSRITPKAVRDLLESARAANMNMLRVWGGGQYEPDWFYDLCDELGLLVWQDFMFSCMCYPADRAFLEDVRLEITQQVRRLSHHASIALWCGDNECIGAIGWHEVTRNNRERYVANYTRLNFMLQTIVEDEDPSRRFWPSSPSLGYLDFSDGWHSDTRGDTHFWQVWHEAAPFERAREVNPRFASEFGFQSFPSMNVIATFTRPEDRNPSSPVMESHQRNTGGNARILETMARYFRFPRDFDQMVFLSQVQQGLAIKTAIEYWRSTKPRCMGTLYWQLNDTYPVASWSSLDYGGQWKPLHYMARRFYRPISVVVVPDGDQLLVKAVNDTAERVTIGVEVLAVDVGGGERRLHAGRARVSPDAATVAARIPLGKLRAGEFLFFTWTDEAGRPLGDNDYFPRAYKEYDLPPARIKASWSGGDGAPVLTLSSDRPAFFVTATVSDPGYFSDNALTLLPGRPARLTFTPRLGARPTRERLAASLRLRHLRETW